MVDQPEPPNLLILGASTRAAAHSAVRAGLRPVCADLFADEDLRAVAEVLPIGRYPHDLPRTARLAPECPWMYTGALENHPRIIEAVSRERPLWGNPADVVRRVRDPLRLQALLEEAHLQVAEVRPGHDPPPADGRWLVKPVRGAGGRGIAVWDDSALDSRAVREPHYFQRRIDGTAVSALYLGLSSPSLSTGGAGGGTDASPLSTPPGPPLVRGGVSAGGVLIGISRQLVGEPALHAPPFGYCGSVGPVRLSASVREQICLAGATLAAECGLRGLFGIDFVCDERHARAIEVNPRYTASVEVYEHACGTALVDWHRRACETFDDAEAAAALAVEVRSTLDRVERTGPGRIVGKAVLFADRDSIAPSFDASGESGSPGERGASAPRLHIAFAVHPEEKAGGLTPPARPGVPPVADVPAPGSLIRAGRPICTVLATGRTVDDCLANLAARADDVLLHMT